MKTALDTIMTHSDLSESYGVLADECIAADYGTFGKFANKPEIDEDSRQEFLNICKRVDQRKTALKASQQRITTESTVANSASQPKISSETTVSPLASTLVVAAQQAVDSPATDPLVTTDNTMSSAAGQNEALVEENATVRAETEECFVQLV
jgi:hypothetical protein